MTKIANIAKNTSYLTIALILQKVISFSYFAILARALGPENLGKYYFAISFTTIFAIFIDLGFINYLTREVAKKQEEAMRLIGSIFGFKILLSILTVAAVIFFTNFLESDPLTRNLVYISMISMVLDSFSTTFFAVIRGFHNLKYESISSVIFQLIVLVFGCLALNFNMGLQVVISTLALASLYNFIYSLFALRYKIGVKFKLALDKNLIITTFRSSWPFALFAIYQRFYTYIDSILLSYFAGDYFVGIYQVAFKIIFALQFLPMAFTATLYPAMSAYWQNNRPQLTIAFERAINYLLIISLPISFFAIIAADKIVLIFKAEYLSAIVPIQIQLASLIFVFLSFPVGSLLNACDRQKKNTNIMLMAMMASIVLNVLLIPSLKATGACISDLLTNALIFIFGMRLVWKIIPYNYKNNTTVFLKALGASVVMALFTFFAKEYFNIILVALLAIPLYFGALFVFGGIAKADIEYIINSFRRKSNDIDPAKLSEENL
ncbi:MAG: flippase [Candidatus Falkowbacteria bacterium]